MDTWFCQARAQEKCFFSHCNKKAAHGLKKPELLDAVNKSWWRGPCRGQIVLTTSCKIYFFSCLGVSNGLTGERREACMPSSSVLFSFARGAKRKQRMAFVCAEHAAPKPLDGHLGHAFSFHSIQRAHTHLQMKISTYEICPYTVYL